MLFFEHKNGFLILLL